MAVGPHPRAGLPSSYSDEQGSLRSTKGPSCLTIEINSSAPETGIAREAVVAKPYHCRIRAPLFHNDISRELTTPH